MVGLDVMDGLDMMDLMDRFYVMDGLDTVDRVDVLDGVDGVWSLRVGRVVLCGGSEQAHRGRFSLRGAKCFLYFLGALPQKTEA